MTATKLKTHLAAGLVPFVWTMVTLVTCAAGCIEDKRRGELPELTQTTREIAIPATLRVAPSALPRGRKELTFAVTPYLPDDVMLAAFQPIAEQISNKLGVTVRFRLAKSYRELIELASTGKVDIVQISPLSYVIAKREMPGLRLLGSSLSFGAAFYSSFIIGRAGIANNWRGLLKNKNKKHKFAFVDKRSGSGFLFPYAELLRLGIDPQRDLQPVFSKSHDKSIKLVLAGDVTAAAVSSGTLNAARTGDVIGAGDLRILHKAGRIPYDALCATEDISESLAAKIAGAFASLNTTTQEGRTALRAARGLTGWVHAEDSQYDEVREKLRQVETAEWRSWKVDEDATQQNGQRAGSMFRSSAAPARPATAPQEPSAQAPSPLPAGGTSTSTLQTPLQDAPSSPPGPGGARE